MFKFGHSAKRLEDEETQVANDQHAPNAHQIAPLIQAVQSKRDYLENLFVKKDQAIQMFNAKIEAAHQDYVSARANAFAMFHELCGDDPETDHLDSGVE